MSADDQSFWGPVPTTAGSRWARRLGPFELWLDVGVGDITIAHRQGLDPMAEGGGPAESPPPDDAESLRFATDPAHLTLVPALADRPVVVRPELPLHLPPGDAVDLVVSTPLWCRVAVGEPPRTLLRMPTYRPSDTWFGPSTQAGELAYASRTQARLKAVADPSSKTRAFTPLRIVNHGSDALVVARVNLPVPRLTLYVADSGVHWTDGVTLNRPGEPDPADVSIDRGAEGLTLVAEPQSEDTRNVFQRAVGSLLG